MKYLLVAVAAYLICAFLTYGAMVGDVTYKYQHDYHEICPEAGDYGRPVLYAVIPFGWPTAAVGALGHKLNEGSVPFGLSIKRPDRCPDPSVER